MSTFTGRELECLAGLNKSWWRLYWRELARLCIRAGIARLRKGRDVTPSPHKERTPIQPLCCMASLNSPPVNAKASSLVVRFQHSHPFAEITFANVGIKGPLAKY